MLFTSEWDKIEYIRDHCKDSAFQIVKARSMEGTVNPYLTAEDMLKDLHSMFGEHNQFAKSDALLHDPKFKMGATKSQETFDEFYARFTIAVAPLNLSEEHLIANLKRTVSSKLRWKIADGMMYNSFADFVQRVRQCDLDVRQADAEGEKQRGSGISRRQNTRSSDQDNAVGSRPPMRRRTSRPAHILTRMRKEGRCFKCGETGHLPNEDKAPCKDKEWVPNDKLILQLKSIEMPTVDPVAENE